MLQLLQAASLRLLDGGGGKEKEKVVQGEPNLPGEGITSRLNFNGDVNAK